MLVELEGDKLPADLAELERLLQAWIERVYHRRVHSETEMTPLARFGGFQPRYPTAAELREAFMWAETRLVSKTATVSLQGNSYEVDQALCGRRVELRFDPYDLATIEVYYAGRPFGHAVPHQIGRHVHPQAQEPAEQERPQSGDRLPEADRTGARARLALASDQLPRAGRRPGRRSRRRHRR